MIYLGIAAGKEYIEKYGCRSQSYRHEKQKHTPTLVTLLILSGN
jgi:hypothetical protein